MSRVSPGRVIRITYATAGTGYDNGTRSLLGHAQWTELGTVITPSLSPMHLLEDILHIFHSSVPVFEGAL